MGWEDRQYYRDRSRPAGSVIWSLLNGSVPLFTAFGIRVRAHASLIILIALVILFDASKGYDIQFRAISMSMLALVILLHEFGHCFAARSVGGEADEILMWPLGGLAYAQPPQRPWPTFVTVAGGPAVNVAICIICALGFWLTTSGVVSLDPFNPLHALGTHKGHSAAAIAIGVWFFWTYQMSYYLLLFNLLPIFPLDGGQMLQSILWPRMGYYRSMSVALVVGMVGSGLLAAFGLLRFELMLVFIALSCFLYCRGRWAMMKEMGPEEYAAQDGIDYSASLRPDDEPRQRKRGKVSRWRIRRLRQQAMQENLLQTRIDEILAKVSAQGMQSLTWGERRTLKKATERQRRRELEMSRDR